MLFPVILLIHFAIPLFCFLLRLYGSSNRVYRSVISFAFLFCCVSLPFSYTCLLVLFALFLYCMALLIGRLSLLFLLLSSSIEFLSLSLIRVFYFFLLSSSFVWLILSVISLFLFLISSSIVLLSFSSIRVFYFFWFLRLYGFSYQVYLSFISFTFHFCCVSILFSYMYSPPPTARAGYDTRSIFKKILTGLNSEFSFSETSCLTMAEEPSLAYYLPVAGGRIIGFIPFPRVLVLCEMQSVSSRIWTRVALSISYDNNHYTTGTSNPFLLYMSFNSSCLLAQLYGSSHRASLSFFFFCFLLRLCFRYTCLLHLLLFLRVVWPF